MPQPGNLYNCKCDWEETDDGPVNPHNADTTHAIASKGLEDNPGETGEVFGKNAPYFKVDGKAKNEVNEFWKPIEEHHQEYLTYKKDDNYKDVAFNWDNGGLIASHKDHHFDGVGGKYERNVQIAGYKTGNKVVFESEIGKVAGERYTEGKWNDKLFEVAGRETATKNNVFRGLKHCASKRVTQIAILDYPKGGFSEEIFYDALKKFNGLEKLNDGQYLKFERIICIQNQIIVLDIIL